MATKEIWVSLSICEWLQWNHKVMVWIPTKTWEKNTPTTSPTTRHDLYKDKERETRFYNNMPHLEILACSQSIC